MLNFELNYKLSPANPVLLSLVGGHTKGFCHKRRIDIIWKSRHQILAAARGFLGAHGLWSQRHRVGGMSGSDSRACFTLTSFDFRRKRQKSLFHVHGIFSTRFQKSDGPFIGKCLKKEIFLHSHIEYIQVRASVLRWQQKQKCMH